MEKCSYSALPDEEENQSHYDGFMDFFDTYLSVTNFQHCSDKLICATCLHGLRLDSNKADGKNSDKKW